MRRGSAPPLSSSQAKRARSISAPTISVRGLRSSTAGSSTSPWCRCSRPSASARCRATRPPSSSRSTSAEFSSSCPRPSGRLVALASGADLDGFAGACIGAPELADLDGLAPRLDELVRRDAVLFVHPGPAARSPAGAPAWWAAVVDYTAQMQAGYAAWLAGGTSRWPSLNVVFSMLAGGAPFQLERLRSRGVSGRDVLHERVFFETSSYGNRALELCMATYGVSQLIFGTDVPVLDPEPGLDAVRGFGDAVTDALCNQNPARLLV